MTMRNRFWAAVAAMLGLSAVAAVAVAGEEKVAFDKLPAAVKKAVKKEFHGARVRGAAKEVENGKTTYEVELTVEGRSVDVAMDANGKILEIEREVSVDRLPAAVKKKLAAKYPGARIQKAEMIARGAHGPANFELSIKTEVVLTPKGKIVRPQHSEEDDEESAHDGKKGKKEHEDADDDDDGDEKGEHHKGSAHGEKKEHREPKEAAHHARKEKKEHEDADDDDDDDEKGEHHKGSAHGEKKEHREPKEAAHHARKEKKEHEDADDDDDEKGEHRSSVKAEKKEHREHGEAHEAKKKEKKEHEDRDDDDDDDEEEDDD